MWSLTDRVCEAPHAQHKKYSAYPGPDGAKFAQGVIFFRHSAIDRMAMTDSGMVRPPTADQIGASEVSNGPRPGVVLRWAHEPRRHARHADAHADASHSGIHTGGEECSMPAWLHSEWRLLHAYVPACSGPARASLSGKRDFKTRDEGTETASLIQFLLCRDRALARDPRQLGAN